MTEARSAQSYDMSTREDWQSAKARLPELAETDPEAADAFFIELANGCDGGLRKLRNLINIGYEPAPGPAATAFVQVATALKDTYPSQVLRSISLAFRLRRRDLAVPLIETALSQHPGNKLPLDLAHLVKKYENDNDETIKHLSKINQADPYPDADLSVDKTSNVKMIRTALGRTTGTVRLYQPSSDVASSVYKPNLDYLKHMMHARSTPLSEMMAVASEIDVEVTDLDTWRHSSGVEPFDFLKLNVQGAELEILDGAPDTLHHCFGMQCEVALAPVCQKAPVFRDMEAFLDKAGFTFFDMRKPTTSGRNTTRTTPFAGSRVGLFRWPSRQMTEAHVLYLRAAFPPGRTGGRTLERSKHVVAAGDRCGNEWADIVRDATLRDCVGRLSGPLCRPRPRLRQGSGQRIGFLSRFRLSQFLRPA
jgi:FkbM family methyltransferase